MAQYLLGHFKDGVLKACDEVCWRKSGSKSEGDAWWWDEEVKEAVSMKKESHKAMYQNSTEESKRKYKGKKIKQRMQFLKQ